ncbi:VanZ family protein [Patulibacter brassicae]|uniref:VanZ family protein n=1 Tax=Patulibacter brassicae TaxID=1705717 RepID=A0ABU4VHD7_9ACTN|nr:VanZ family protein [Patulibacter brassicae]MDX8150346.1 VanZ family protein [Patulibacter brassicae]
MRAAGSHAPRAPWRACALLLPPLALMGVIWFLSSRSDLGGSGGWLGLVLRKGAHMTEFGLLAVLWARALRALWTPRAPVALVGGAAIALAWAITDELHQATVPGRHGTPVDVLIDGGGIVVGTLLLAVVWRRWAAPRRPGRGLRASRAPRR